MVITQRDGHHLREFPLVRFTILDHIFKEPVRLRNIRNIHVKNRKIEAGIVPESFGHGEVDDFRRTGTGRLFILTNSGKLEAFAVVAEGNLVSLEMLP